MTDNNHPITPPPELIAKWASSMCGHYEAARWGADQELESCRLWVSENCDIYSAVELIQFRRPKLPNLKKLALKQLDSLHSDLKLHGMGTNTDNIRRALEALPD